MRSNSKPENKPVYDKTTSAIKKISEVIVKAGEMLEAIGDGVSILDRTFRILYENEAHKKILGSHIGEKCYKAYQLREGICGGCPVALTFKDGKTHTVLRHKETDEGIKYFEITASPLKDGTGEIIAGVEVIRDITMRREVEEALRQSEYRYRTLVETSLVGVWNITPDGYTVYINPEMCAMLEIEKPEDIEGMTYHSFFTPESLIVMENEHRKRPMGIPSRYEVEIVGIKGRRSNVVISGAPILGADGKLESLIGTFTDITERKHSEQALKENEQKLRHITEHSNEIYYIHDINNVLTYVSPQSLQILGYTPDEMMIEWTNIVTDNPINEKGMEITEKALKTGEKQPQYLLELFRKDGNRVLLEIDESPFKDERGFVAGLAGAARDVTSRVKAEEALKVSEAELHDSYFAQSTINMILSESLENIPLQEILQKALNMILSVPWLSFEATGSIHLVEDKPDCLIMKAQYNLPKTLIKSCARVPFGKCLCGKAAQSQKIEFADHIDERHEICYEGIVNHGHYVVPLLFGGKTLGILDVHLKEGHIRNRKEEDFLHSVADILAGIIVRKRAEEEKEKLHAQLLQAQKMEAVGQLAGGIAHDFNNILQAMIGYGQLLKIKMKEENPLRNYADHILSLSDKAANLTKSLLAFSRKQIINPRPADINEIIKRIEHLLSRIIGEDIQLQTTFSEEDLIVMADPGQIEQVLMNLATNARDAMPEGGLLDIRTESVDITQEFIREHGFGEKGKYALLSFADTGVGMDTDTKEKIFEPFFTTKAVGKGTGLGLAMVYGIIKQHEGHINIYSEPEKGTTFRIYLPLIKAETEDAEPEIAQAVRTGSETVLLTEDETEVRESTEHLLKENGYQVINAVNGQDAIDKFRLYNKKIDIVLLDVIMPKKNGREVYDEIRQVMPDIKVLFMSGHQTDIIRRLGIIEKEYWYIEKPVSPDRLLSKIREILDA